MNTAEELAAVFGFDVTEESFWSSSIDVIRGHIQQYSALAAELNL
jgi:oligoendopeptidase F